MIAAHPGLTIDLSGATSGDQFNRIELSQAGAVADKPDIFQLDNIWLGQFVDEGIADVPLDLTDDLENCSHHQWRQAQRWFIQQ